MVREAADSYPQTYTQSVVVTYRVLFILVASLVAMSSCSSSSSTGSDAVAEQAVSWADREVPPCGQTNENADYLGLEPGSIVRLHQQRTDDIAPNWTPEMGAHVDHVTAVTDLVGVDGEGCPSIRVEVDNGIYAWRVRDLEPLEGTADETRCGQTDLDTDFRGLEVGDTVTVGEHNPWYGQENWTDAMNAFVGQEAVIQELVGVDDSGCPGAVLDIDQGDYFWRVRDLHPVK